MKSVCIIVMTGIIALSISSCATSKYGEKLSSWVGRDVNDLITAWGPPSDESTMPNGNKMYTWLRVNNTNVTTSHYNEFLDRTATRLAKHWYWCKTTFQVDTSERVIDWDYDGNSCGSN